MFVYGGFPNVHSLSLKEHTVANIHSNNCNIFIYILNFASSQPTKLSTKKICGGGGEVACGGRA